jgi:hypothetical protein
MNRALNKFLNIFEWYVVALLSSSLLMGTLGCWCKRCNLLQLQRETLMKSVSAARSNWRAI